MEYFTCMGPSKWTLGFKPREVVSMTFWLAQQLALSMEGADLFHRSGSPLAPGRGAEPERPGQTPRRSRWMARETWRPPWMPARRQRAESVSKWRRMFSTSGAGSINRGRWVLKAKSSALQRPEKNQAKTINIGCFKLLKCEDFLFVCFFHCALNIFWAPLRKLDIFTIFSHFIEQTINQSLRKTTTIEQPIATSNIKHFQVYHQRAALRLKQTGPNVTILSISNDVSLQHKMTTGK